LDDHHGITGCLDGDVVNAALVHLVLDFPVSVQTKRDGLFADLFRVREIRLRLATRRSKSGSEGEERKDKETTHGMALTRSYFTDNALHQLLGFSVRSTPQHCSTIGIPSSSRRAASTETADC